MWLFKIKGLNSKKFIFVQFIAKILTSKIEMTHTHTHTQCSYLSQNKPLYNYYCCGAKYFNLRKYYEKNKNG